MAPKYHVLPAIGALSGVGITWHTREIRHLGMLFVDYYTFQPLPRILGPETKSSHREACMGVKMETASPL